MAALDDRPPEEHEREQGDEAERRPDCAGHDLDDAGDGAGDGAVLRAGLGALAPSGRARDAGRACLPGCAPAHRAAPAARHAAADDALRPAAAAPAAVPALAAPEPAGTDSAT